MKADLHRFVDRNPDRPRTYYEKLHPQPPYVWRPVLTEQEKSEREAYIKEHNLPF